MTELCLCCTAKLNCLETMLVTELCLCCTAKLNSCLETMRSIVGDSVSEAALTDAVIATDYNSEQALNIVLSTQGFCPTPPLLDACPVLEENRTSFNKGLICF